MQTDKEPDMGRIVGIDLGTTYSAVAIPEERSGEGFMVVRGCPGYSVILDKYKNRITPSVVAEDSRGEVIVGMIAKNRAGQFPEPVMFAKRSMGEDVRFKLDKQGELTPVQVSAHILRYLKKVAEDRLGEPVDEAVITVPAYFALRAKQATEEAGKLAGLKVAQIAQEPVAAALMYCMGDNRESLRVMTYDLGGGTFDIAVLEKREGAITSDSVLTFDGDRFLGGYNFDCMLADWLLNQINALGYNLRLDMSIPADRVINAKLLVTAERVKRRLSDEPLYTFTETDFGFEDHDGVPVTCDGLTIERETFEAMIEKTLDGTIELCLRALNKVSPPISPDTLDEILMVGGSSRIPMVTRKLELAFGRRPRLVEPDLCVALGAAILAGTRGKTYGKLKLDPIPTETDLPCLTITGWVLSPGAADLSGHSARLRATDGSCNLVRKTNAEGAFIIAEAPLTPEQTTDFVLSVTDPQGGPVGEHRFSVHQTAVVKTTALTPVTNILAKPINIETVDGLYEVAPERTWLPHNAKIAATTSDTTGKIIIPIFEDNNPLGEIKLTEIPETLPVGSSIDIELEIKENYQIVGRAYVKALAREATIVIDIPIPPVKSVDELEADFRRLSARADEVLRAAGSGVRFGNANAKRLMDLLKEVEGLLAGRTVEAPMVQDRLDVIEGLIRKINLPPRFEPPRAVFEAKAEEARDLLEEATAADERVTRAGYAKQLEAILKQAQKAYQANNLPGWKSAYENLSSLCSRLE
jgi:actin-like ATPase involved in cell morphogenesis